MARPLVAHIDLAALQYNYALVKRMVAPAQALAVIKANAYGHGVLPVAYALQQQAAGFALIEIEAACQLREEGIQQPILLLEGVFEEAELMLCRQHDLMVTVHTMQQVNWLMCLSEGAALQVFLKVNSGMNRLGLRPEEVGKVVPQLQALSCIKSICLMTHFSDADESDTGIASQWSVFQALQQKYPALPICAANSAAIIRYPQTHGDWVRPGVVLYGASPFHDASAHQLGLRPVMHLLSQLIAIQTLAPGDRVGYGSTFTADRLMRVGVVAVGYADGYPRHAPSGTPIRVLGQPCTLVGRVSMDMLCVDISQIPEAQIGSPVELWGQNLPIDEVATVAGTISYELMCALTARVPLVHTKGPAI